MVASNSKSTLIKNNPFSIQINSSSPINNLYRYILYNYVSSTKGIGIQLKQKYSDQFINNKTNKINRNQFLNYHINNNGNTTKLFQNFISMFDESTIEFAFCSDIPRIQLYINQKLFFNYEQFNNTNNPIRKKYIQFIHNIKSSKLVNKNSNNLTNNNHSNNENRNTIIARHNQAIKNNEKINMSELPNFLNEKFNSDISKLLSEYNYDQKYLLLLNLLCTQITMATPIEETIKQLQTNTNKGTIIYKQKNYKFYIKIDETQILFENEIDLNFSILISNNEQKSIGDYHFSFSCDLLKNNGTICIYSTDFLNNPYQINIKNKNKKNKQDIIISNLKQYCIYNYLSLDNNRGILMNQKYVPIFYNQINNQYNLNNFKILCSNYVNEIIQAHFFDILDEKTIISQFQKDYHRSIFQINGNLINQEKMNANQFLEQIISNSNINNNYKLFIPLVCNQVSQANISLFIMNYFDTRYHIKNNTSYKFIQNKDIIYNIETNNNNRNILINIICIYEVHKFLNNNITAPREIVQISQKFNLSKNQLTIIIEDLPLINNKNNNKNNSNISSKFQKNIYSLQYVPIKTNVIPIKKNPSQIIKKNPDFYLLTFNEGAESYQYTLQKYTSYLSELQPKIIAVCTQESRSGGQEHFQHIMKKYLIKNNYALINKFNASSKAGDIIPGKTNKNVRTRIYYHQNFILKNINNNLTNTENSNSNSNISSIKSRSNNINNYNSNKSNNLNSKNSISIQS